MGRDLINMNRMAMSKVFVATAVLAAIVFTSVADASDPSPLDMLSEDFLNVDLETDTGTEKEVNLETEIGEKDDESVSGKRRRRAITQATKKAACIDDDGATFGNGAGNCRNLRERKAKGVNVSSNCKAQAGSYCRKTCNK